MKQTHAELLNSQTSANENTYSSDSISTKNTELLHREKVEGSPFYIIGNKEEGFFLSFGKYRLTELQETVVKVREELYNNMWDIVMKLCLTIIQDVDFKKIRDEEPHKTVNDMYKEDETFDDKLSLGRTVKNQNNL